MEATAHGTLDLTDETRAVLDALPVAISAGAAIRDAAGRIVDLRTIFVNAAAERDTRRDRGVWSDELFRIFGVSPSEHTPSYQGYIDRVHAEDRDQVAAVLEEAARDGRPFTFDERIVRPDGTVRLLRCGGRVTLD